MTVKQLSGLYRFATRAEWAGEHIGAIPTVHIDGQMQDDILFHLAFHHATVDCPEDFALDPVGYPYALRQHHYSASVDRHYVDALEVAATDQGYRLVAHDAPCRRHADTAAVDISRFGPRCEVCRDRDEDALRWFGEER